MFPLIPATDEINTIRPHLFFIIPFIALCEARKDPVKFVSITESQSSCFNLGKILSFVIPALLTKISTDENSFSISSKHFSTESLSVTSI